jgi:hypothetical protein
MRHLARSNAMEQWFQIRDASLLSDGIPAIRIHSNHICPTKEGTECKISLA